MSWAERRIGDIADLVNGFPFDSKDFSDEGDTPLVRIRDITDSRFETFVSHDVVPSNAAVRDGDVVVGMDGDFNVVLWSRGLAALNQRLCLLRSNGRADMRFLAYALPPHLRRINDLTYATTVKHLASSQVRAIRIAAPPLPEQRAIADYLDRETAQIDTLIEEQKQLLQLAHERFRAVVRRNTTPSEAWRRSRVKHIGSTSLGKMLDGGRAVRDDDRVAPYVRAADVLADGSINLIDLNEMPFSSSEMNSLDLRTDDILLIEGGATVGRPGHLRKGAPGISFQKTVNRLRVGANTSARFVYWMLDELYHSDYYPKHFGSVSFVHLTGEKLREISLPLPSTELQYELAREIDEAQSRAQALLAETQQFIELSRERRAALITAAVTGLIDVEAVA